MKCIFIITACLLGLQSTTSFGFDIFDPFGSKAKAAEMQLIGQHRDACLVCTKILLRITEGKYFEAKTHGFYLSEAAIVLDAGEGICRIGEAEVLIARNAANHPGVVDLKNVAKEVKNQLESRILRYSGAVP